MVNIAACFDNKGMQLLVIGVRILLSHVDAGKGTWTSHRLFTCKSALRANEVSVD
jgi:hypothetical protein